MADFNQAASARAPEDSLFWGVSFTLGSNAPVHITNCDKDVTIGSTVFQEIPFQLRPIDDVEGREPEVELRVTNVGEELTSWLDSNDWGAGARARVFQYALGTDNSVDIGIDRTLIVANVRADENDVVARFGYRNLLNRPSVKVRYDAEIAPGLS